MMNNGNLIIISILMLTIIVPMVIAVYGGDSKIEANISCKPLTREVDGECRMPNEK